MFKRSISVFTSLGTRSEAECEEREELFNELKQHLSFIGIDLVYNIKTSEFDAQNCEHVTFYWDPVTVYQKKSRKAGNHYKEIRDSQGSPIRLSEVTVMLEKETADTIAKKLNIGRATLFRRIKRASAIKEEMLEFDPDFDPFL